MLCTLLSHVPLPVFVYDLCLVVVSLCIVRLSTMCAPYRPASELPVFPHYVCWSNGWSLCLVLLRAAAKDRVSSRSFCRYAWVCRAPQYMYIQAKGDRLKQTYDPFSFACCLANKKIHTDTHTRITSDTRTKNELGRNSKVIHMVFGMTEHQEKPISSIKGFMIPSHSHRHLWTISNSCGDSVSQPSAKTIYNYMSSLFIYKG